jgi:Trypsin-like peptidase domain
MQLPTKISEQLQFTTIRLEVGNSRGTGFIFDYNGDNSNPIIVTNKHVIEQMSSDRKVNFYLHTIDGNNISSQSIRIEYQTVWIAHPIQDLCYTFLNPILNVVKNNNVHPYFMSISSKLIPTQKDLEALSVTEEVVMIGYPNGLWDENNNLPIFRKGFTAFNPSLNFKNKEQTISEDNIGVVDIACFPGSSGSPIFVIKEEVQKIFFMGILYKGPLFYQQSVNRDITPSMMNLGYYIKSNEILSFFAKN